MKKLLLTLTLIFSLAAFQTVYANDFGGGFDDVRELRAEAIADALHLLGLKGDRRNVLKYDQDTKNVVLSVKKALGTFVAEKIEKKFYITKEELAKLDLSLGEVLAKDDDEAYIAWLEDFFAEDFHGLRTDGMVQGETHYKRWNDSVIGKLKIRKKKEAEAADAAVTVDGPAED